MTAPPRTFPGLLTYPCILAVTLIAGSCSSPSADTAPDARAARLTVEVTRTLPHDTSAFTQGLEISGDELFESTGRNGMSYVQVTDLDSGAVLRRADLSDEYFGEGITVTDDIVWQVTWREGVAFARDPVTLDEIRRVEYDGEGWGLCHGAETGLLMSDGTSTLTSRDPDTFDVVSTTEVTLDGEPLTDLNELECASDGSVYANVWQTFDIARIDPQSGTVTAMIDATPLWESMPAEQRAGADVLNGIAQIPGTERFLVTGKLWPSMFDVRFAPR